MMHGAYNFKNICGNFKFKAKLIYVMLVDVYQAAKYSFRLNLY
jgi:hypothetical protein